MPKSQQQINAMAKACKLLDKFLDLQSINAARHSCNEADALAIEIEKLLERAGFGAIDDGDEITGGQAAELVGRSRKVIAEWARKGWLVPVTESDGMGQAATYLAADVRALAKARKK